LIPIFHGRVTVACDESRNSGRCAERKYTIRPDLVDVTHVLQKPPQQISDRTRSPPTLFLLLHWLALTPLSRRPAHLRPNPPSCLPPLGCRRLAPSAGAACEEVAAGKGWIFPVLDIAAALLLSWRKCPRPPPSLTLPSPPPEPNSEPES
jgi:hypothetical protein